MSDVNGNGHAPTGSNGSLGDAHLFPGLNGNGALPNTHGAILGLRPTESQEYALNELAINEYSMRLDYLRRLADPRRDIDYECGFPKDQLPPQMYQDLYDYDAIANRVVEVLPKEMWKVTPLVYEKEEGQKATAWEREWDKLGSMVSPQQSWFKEEKGSAIWNTLLRADIACGIGQFGVIYLGVDDGLDPRYPVDGMDPDDSGSMYAGTDQQYGDYLGQLQRSEVAQRELAKAQLKSMVPYNPYAPVKEIKRSRKRHKLLWMEVFPESLVQVIRWEARRSSPRYGQPVMYLVTLVDPRQSVTGIGRPLGTVQVHWTRVVHIVDTTYSVSPSRVLGTPRLQPVRKHIYSLQKVYGASSEGYWRSAFPILHTKTQTGLGGNVKYNKQKMKDMMERLFNSMDRSAITTGFDMEMLSPSLIDPTPYLDKNIEGICVKIPCPVPVFKGYEIGEQASENNDKKWDDELTGRQAKHGTPNVIVPFTDRCILLGILPEPADGYQVEWPPYDTQSESEKAQVASTKATTLSTYAGPGNASSVYPPYEFLTRVMGEKDEVADAILAAAEAHVEDQQQQQMDQQQQQIDAGLAPDPSAGQDQQSGSDGSGGGGASDGSPDGGQPPTQNLRDRSDSDHALRRKLKRLKREHAKTKAEYEKSRTKLHKKAEKDREERERLAAATTKRTAETEKQSVGEQRAHEIELAKIKKGNPAGPTSPPPIPDKGWTRNTFCAKGKGGGIDPHCGKHGAVGGSGGGTALAETPAASTKSSGLFGRLKSAVGLGGKGATNPTQPVGSVRDKAGLDHQLASSKEYQDQRKAVDAKYQPTYDALGKRMGKTADEVKTDIAGKAQKFADGQSVYVRVPDHALPSILADGRFKTQHELKATSGFYDPKGRAAIESKSQGVPTSTDPKHRPVSMYLGEHDFASAHTDGMQRYGGVMVKMKDHVRDRATVTFGDSAEIGGNGYGVATPLKSVGHNSANPKDFAANEKMFDSPTDYRKSKAFAEVQVHGGVHASDIEEVGFHADPPAHIQQHLHALGIKWRVLKHPAGG